MALLYFRVRISMATTTITAAIQRWEWQWPWTLIILERSPASASSSTIMSSLSSINDARYFITFGWSRCFNRSISLMQSCLAFASIISKICHTQCKWFTITSTYYAAMLPKHSNEIISISGAESKHKWRIIFSSFCSRLWSLKIPLNGFASCPTAN